MNLKEWLWNVNYLVSNNNKSAKYHRQLNKAKTYIESATRDLTPNGIMTSALVNKLYWWLNFGETIYLQWPRGEDVNDAWRTWLETNVGRQGFDWHWRVNYTSGFKIEIKFRKKIYASLFVLMFGLETC